MTTTHTAPAATDEISQAAVDRIVMMVDTYAEQAKRSAVVTDRITFRRRVLRLNRQARFARVWGLR